jgi:integrase/recombinase XerD
LAGIYRRGSTWWVRFTWRGQEVRKSARTSSKVEAQRLLGSLLDQYKQLDRNGQPRRTYQETLSKFTVEYLATLKPSTAKRYRVSFRQLGPHFGGVFLDEINKTRLSSYVSARKKADASDATIRRDLATLSCLCSCAVVWDFIETNPVKTFSKRHLREAPPKTAYPSDDQIDRLVEHASPMAGRLIRFLAHTGVRQEEACSLEWGQVSLERREVRLTKTKTSSPRVVPLSKEAVGTLLGTPRHTTSNFVFWHDDGQRYSQFANGFVAIARKAGVPYRCHDLRHRFASVFLQNTGDLAALQAILGHRSITMTMRYAHMITDHLHRAVAKLDESSRTKVGTDITVSAQKDDGARGQTIDSVG